MSSTIMDTILNIPLKLLSNPTTKTEFFSSQHIEHQLKVFFSFFYKSESKPLTNPALVIFLVTSPFKYEPRPCAGAQFRESLKKGI